MYDQLRFQGYYIHEDEGFKQASAIVQREMEARKPDEHSPSGYQPDSGFIKSINQFGTDFRELRDDLLTRARNGEKIDRAEIITIDRAEKLYAIGSAPGPRVADARMKSLADGKEAFNAAGGMSAARLLTELSGNNKDKSAAERFTVSIDHGYRR